MPEHTPTDRQWPSEYRSLANGSVSSADGRYELRPIRWTDREDIRTWRNAQIEALRQTSELSVSDQDRYFSSVVLPQFDQMYPDQILFAFLEEGQLIGYGGLVHIVWSDQRAEVSFLTAPQRLDSVTFTNDWVAYLTLLTVLAQRLGLRKLTTETYSMRSDLIAILEGYGFEREGVLRGHHVVDGTAVDSYAHAFFLS